MTDLPTVVLHHQLADAGHYDWLLGDPADPDQTGPLVTFRCAEPPMHWPADAESNLTALPSHRRRYLQYQGPLSRQRGSVRRVAEGKATAELWTEHHRILRLDWPGRGMRVELRHRSGDAWIARVLAD